MAGFLLVVLKMKYIFSFIISVVFLLSSNDSAALTKEDCRERVNNAMHNSDVLRGSEADRYRWAQNAADECFKEIAQSGSSSYSGSSGSSGSSGMGWLWILGGLGVLYWMFYRPDVNGFRIPFVDSPEEKAAKLAEANKSNEEKDFERRFNRTYALRKQLRFMIPHLTVEEIATQTESDKLGTVIWLAEENKACKNFDGLASVTIEDLERLTGASIRMISAKLNRRGMKCKENKKIEKSRKNRS